jgi:hypothetical protein
MLSFCAFSKVVLWNLFLVLVMSVLFSTIDSNCRNPNLGLATKARGYKVASQEKDLGVTSHAHGSAKECEGMNPHTPKWTPMLGVRVLNGLPKLQSTIIGVKTHCLEELLISLENLLKLKCLKWVHISHLDIWNTSYGQKKGQESNWQFDSGPLKVENWPNFLTCRQHARYHWKALDKVYNFALDLITIKGLHVKLCAPKIAKVPTVRISGLWEFRDSHLGVSGQKAI